MRFLMNDFKVIEADTLDEAVIAYCREHTTAYPPIDVAIIGANVKYQIREIVERVVDEEPVTRRSKFQADLLDELEHCDSIGRNFHVNNHADIEDLSRRKMITINEREGNYFVITLLKGESNV